ncbi:acid phosphatase det1 [Rhizophlyctis rosea]|uniref:Acid phosphatase det1 n=1 Tax=Rhizophlyctis rosea TaxID=64517 RepID=A0AAD5X8Q0_9FUNG|nr:acid phosphatase det1 [Rhizophlyctis rosea]
MYAQVSVELHFQPSLKNISQILDKKSYKGEFLYLPNHAGVHLHDQTLAITSVEHQTIYMLHIKDSGQFMELRTVGLANYEDDELVLSRYREAEQAYQQSVDERQAKRRKIGVERHASGFGWTTASAIDATGEQMQGSSTAVFTGLFAEQGGTEALTGLKQRIMSYLYRRAVASKDRR